MFLVLVMMKLVKLFFIVCLCIKSICCDEDIACDDTSEGDVSYTCTSYNECEHYNLNAARLHTSENVTEVTSTQKEKNQNIFLVSSKQN